MNENVRCKNVSRHFWIILKLDNIKHIMNGANKYE